MFLPGNQYSRKDKQKDASISLRVYQEEKERWTAIANAHNKSLTEYICDLLKEKESEAM